MRKLDELTKLAIYLTRRIHDASSCRMFDWNLGQFVSGFNSYLTMSILLERIKLCRGLIIQMLVLAGVSLSGSFVIEILLDGGLSKSHIDEVPLTAKDFLYFGLVVLIGPLLETLVLRLTLKVTTVVLDKLKVLPRGAKRIASCIFCGVFFGLLHGIAATGFNWGAAFSGIVFTYILLSVTEKYGRKSAFWACSGTHAIHNFVAVVTVLLLRI